MFPFALMVWWVPNHRLEIIFSSEFWEHCTIVRFLLPPLLRKRTIRISLRLYITSLPSQKAFRIIFSQCYTLRLFSSMRLEMLWLLLQSGNLFQYSEILYYFFIIPSLLFSFNGTLITKFKWWTFWAVPLIFTHLKKCLHLFLFHFLRGFPNFVFKLFFIFMTNNLNIE